MLTIYLKNYYSFEEKNITKNFFKFFNYQVWNIRPLKLKKINKKSGDIERIKKKDFLPIQRKNTPIFVYFTDWTLTVLIGGH